MTLDHLNKLAERIKNSKKCHYSNSKHYIDQIILDRYNGVIAVYFDGVRLGVISDSNEKYILLDAVRVREEQQKNEILENL